MELQNHCWQDVGRHRRIHEVLRHVWVISCVAGVHLAEVRLDVEAPAIKGHVCFGSLVPPIVCDVLLLFLELGLRQQVALGVRIGDPVHARHPCDH